MWKTVIEYSTEYATYKTVFSVTIVNSLQPLSERAPFQIWQGSKVRLCCRYAPKIIWITKESQCLVNKSYIVYNGNWNLIFFLSFLKVYIFPDSLVSEGTSYHILDASQSKKFNLVWWYKNRPFINNINDNT